MTEPTPLPLAGVRVLDIGTLIAGPFAATLLGDFGAEVIKVEQPGRGDNLRGLSSVSEGDDSGGSADIRQLQWAIDARNKRSITLNLRVPAGQALLKSLIEHADVLIENFTPGTLERWDLGFDTLKQINPKLIMLRVSGYGQSGPYAKRPGYDRIALGFSGYMYPTGFPDRYPVRPAFPTADYNTATFGAFALMLALYQRDANGGQGQAIDLALYEPMFRITADLVANYARTGAIRERIGNRNPTFAPAGTFETRDGRYVQIAAGGDKVWQRLTVAMGTPELASDTRYAAATDRMARADELEALLAEWVGARDFAEVEQKLVGANVPVGGIYTAADIADDPHYAARESLLRYKDDLAGEVPMPGIVPKLLGTPGRVRSLGPTLGADNEAIYQGLLGKSADDLAKLRSDGVI